MADPPPQRSLTADLRWRIGGGILYAALYSIVGGGIVLLRLGPPALGRVLGVVAVYFVSGLAVGAVLGLMRPLGASRARCVAIGVLAALPLGLTVGTLFTIVDGQRLDWFGVVGVAVLCGTFIGVSWWQSIAPRT
ncbi:hypothetical protein J421_5311 (plasmid) [Gemmatirosa kalamazoonensis]|uniref:Uncharacterized protein n=1 Tax=Gemmatirosa kalamazoonensis TaxID=861299 RepID=W0RQ63_9BACT|nr:hypothetical protein [Gemmatirosa kalamazoonensis]AHG92846.1 hypothetical protein J421_5311 [Gemmatirosa kalamazoonensis]